MNRRFHLYPDGPEQQRLRLSLSLMDIHRLEGFDEAIASLEVEVIEAEERKMLESWQELIIRPPIPRELIKVFGQTLVDFATAQGLQYQEPVLFIDHTEEMEEMERRIKAKLASPETPSLKSFGNFASREDFEIAVYGHILSAEEYEESLNRMKEQILRDFHVSDEEVEVWFEDDYALLENKRAEVSNPKGKTT